MALMGKHAPSVQLHSFIAVGLCLVSLVVISANNDADDGSGELGSCTEDSTGPDCANCTGRCNWMLTSSCDHATDTCTCNPGVDVCVCDPSYVAGSTCRTDPLTCKRCSGFCIGNSVTSSSCDARTGNCRCRPGHGGPLCDICETPNKYFHKTNTTCVESRNLLPAGYPVDSSPVNSSYTIKFLTPFPYGENFASYDDVTISIEGFMSLAGFTGGYNANWRVNKDIALVAPFWTSTTNKCPTDNQNAQVDAAHFNLSMGDNKVLKDRLRSAIRNSNLIDSKDFDPTEAVMGLWRSQRENFEDKEQNNFQAVITHDECQSFAVFVYPEDGMSWAGSPPAVVAAGEILGPSGTDQVLNWTRNSSMPRVFPLTPGCRAEVRARRRCLSGLSNLAANTGKDAPLPCPLTKIAADNTILFRQAKQYNEDSLECYTSEESSVRNAVRCCYDNTLSLVDVGPYQPFSTPNLTAEFPIYQDCRNGGVLEKFFTVRKPVATVVQPYYQAHLHGRGHFTTLQSEYVYRERIDNAERLLRVTDQTGSETFLLTMAILRGGLYFVEANQGGKYSLINITQDGFSKNMYTNQTYKCRSHHNVSNIVYFCIDRIGLRFERLSNQEISVAIQVPHDFLSRIAGPLYSKAVFDPAIPIVTAAPTTSSSTEPTPPPVGACNGNEACKNELMASSNFTAALITRNNDLALSNLASAVTMRAPSLLPTNIYVDSTNGNFGQTSLSYKDFNDSVSFTLDPGQSNVFLDRKAGGTYLKWNKDLRKAVRVRVTVNNSAFVVRTIPVNLCPCPMCSSVVGTTAYPSLFTIRECTGSCTAGYTGKFCQIPLPNPCTPQPCGLRMCTANIALQSYSCSSQCPPGTELAPQRPRAVCQYIDPCKSGNFVCPAGAQCEVDRYKPNAYNCRCPSSLLVDKTWVACGVPRTSPPQPATTDGTVITTENTKVPRAEVQGNSSARAVRGQQAVFTCLLYDVQDGGVTWLNPENETISSTPTQLHKIKTTTGANGTVQTILTITADNAYQNGKYLCTGTNQAGTGLAEFAFTAFEVPPKVVRHPDTKANNSAAVGSTAQFKCVLTGEGLGTLSWVDHDRYEVVNNTRQMSYTLEKFPDRVESTLTIDVVAYTQAGKYTCRATNQYGTTEQAFHLALSHDDTDIVNLILIGLASVSGGTVIIGIIATSIFSMYGRTRRKSCHTLEHGTMESFPMKKHPAVVAGRSVDNLQDSASMSSCDNEMAPPVPARRTRPSGLDTRVFQH